MAETEAPRKTAPGFEGVRQFEVMLHVPAVIFIPDEVYVLGAEAVEEAIEGKVSRAFTKMGFTGTTLCVAREVPAKGANH